IMFHPTLTLRGLHSGFLGKEANTVIPHKATALIEFRMVKNQRWEKVCQRVLDHIRGQGYTILESHDAPLPDELRGKAVRVISKPGYDPAKTSLELPISREIIAAVERAAPGERAGHMPALGASGPASASRAGGMSDAHAETTAGMMVETDLRGVDSHGISMLPTYDTEFRAGRLNMNPAFKTVRETVATALIDADASLGHPVSVHAMNLAVDKCRNTGVAVVSVFNSHHFGAAGCYARIAADRGVLGMVTSAQRGGPLWPTFA